MRLPATPIFLFFVLLSSTVKSDAETCTHDPATFRCVKYIRNYDGDTITFQIPGVHPLIGDNIQVRVRGFDTPEVKGKLPCEKERARDAQRLVRSLLEQAQKIELKNVERDKYFRILADVEADGKSIGPTLLKNQLAYTYDGGTKARVNWCSLNSKNRSLASPNNDPSHNGGSIQPRTSKKPR